MFVMGSMRSSEFELQSRIYSELINQGFYVRGEVRGIVSGVKTGLGKGNRVRLDIVIFSDKECRKPIFAIEVKPKRSIGWIKDYKNTQQHFMYQNLGMPILMILGEDQARQFLQNPKGFMHPSNGLHWIEP